MLAQPGGQTDRFCVPLPLPPGDEKIIQPLVSYGCLCYNLDDEQGPKESALRKKHFIIGRHT
jgi:hypothetical protein